MKIIAKKIYGKTIITSLDEHIALPEDGQYLFEIRASAKSWWQNTAERRTLLKKDSLMLTLNSKEIFSVPKKRKLRADDFWNGNVLHGNNQTIYIVMHSLKGDASIGFIVHGKPFLEEVNVYSISDGEVALRNLSPSKRDRTPWLTLLMAEGVTLNLISLSARAAVLGDDDQDIKIILDGKKEPNQKNTTHKDWYWCGYALRDKPLKFERYFEDENGPSRIDFIADGTPIIQSFMVKVQVAQLDYPVPRLYRPGPRGEDYNKYDSLIAKVVHDWNQKFLTKKQPVPNPLDPSLVKAIAYQESRLGYGANTVNYPAYPDIMQVGDTRNPAIHVLRSEKGFEEREWDDEKGRSSILRFSEHTEMRESRDSIYWGVRWLYHKAQYIKDNKRAWKSWEEAVEGYHKKGDAQYRMGVMKVYRQGIDSKGIRIWFFAAGLALLMFGAMTAFGLSNGMSERTTSEEVLKGEILKNQIYVIGGNRISLHDGFHIFSSNLTESERKQINPYDYYKGPYYVRYETGVVVDLNGDGRKDGLAVLGVNYGGTGYYTHLAEVLSQSDGTYKHVGSYVFQDRDVVADVSVRNGVVEVISIEHGPDDPSCCPTVHLLKKLTLADFLISQ